jgi:DNA-binding NtrC family response regulator
MENIVLFIEKEKFIRNLAEELFSIKKGKIYTIESISNNFYLIEDLKPKIVMFDVQSIGEHLDQILAYKNIKFIAIGSTTVEENAVKEKVAKFIKKPLVVATLFEQIMSVLN